MPRITGITKKEPRKMATTLGIALSNLYRMLNENDSMGPYEAALNRQLDYSDYMADLSRQITKGEHIRGERLG